MQEEYNGYTICLNEWINKFSVWQGHTVVKQDVPNVMDCRAWIDTHNKKKFKRVSVFYRFSHGDYEAAEATSVIDDSHVWVCKKDKREKARIASVLVNTPDNCIILSAIAEKGKTIEQLKTEIAKLESSAERLTAEMMIMEESK